MQPKPTITLRRTGPTTAAVEYRTAKLPTKEDFIKSTDELLESIERDGPIPPAFWLKGQLLNVRDTGAEYIITIFPEEFDPRYPERALRFTNTAHCQNFVSNWYAREHQDPRAF